MNDYQKAKDELTNNLRELADSVPEAAPVADIVCEINCTDIVPNVYWTRVAKPIIEWCGSNQGVYIYTIRCSSDVNPSEILVSYRAVKNDNKDGRAYPEINEVESSVLYVGSSKYLSDRIKQHFGYGPKKTYALNLCQWATDLHGSMIISCICFTGNTPANVIQTLEDGLRKQEQPMFGSQEAM